MKKFKGLDYYILSPESQYLERKSARVKPVDILQHLVAFANADGGSLVIGVEDDGELTGFSSVKASTIEEFKNIALISLKETPISVKYETLDIVNHKKEKDYLLVLSVEPSYNRVIHSYDSNVFLRQTDKSYKLNHEQITQLEYDRGQRYFEDELVKDSSLDDIDSEIMDFYRDRMDISISNQEILEARNLMREGVLTNAGVLLFAQNPTKYLPQAKVKFIRYDGIRAGLGRATNIIKERTFDGSLPKVIQEIKEFIHTQLREFQYLDVDGIFKSMPEYPEFAWVEGIVNAVTHRNYSVRGDYIRFSMFDDRIEIHSPGLLPNIVTLENIQHQRYSRNPRIARVLSEFGWVKEMNEGVKRIYTEMESFFLKNPIFSEPNHNVLLVLENNILNRNVRITDNIKKQLGEEFFSSLSKNEKEVIRYAFFSNHITVKDVSSLLERSLIYTRSILKRLAKLDILEWHGSSLKDPKQYYTLKK